MASGAEMLFGQIAIQNKFVAQADLDRMVAEQQRRHQAGRGVPLGRLLVEYKILTEAQVQSILELQRFVEVRELDKSFGRLAVANGFVTDGQLQRCLDAQKLTFKGKKQVRRIGELMVESGLITQQQRDAILARQGSLAAAGAPANSKPAASQPLGSAPPRPSGKNRKPVEVIVHERPTPVMRPPETPLPGHPPIRAAAPRAAGVEPRAAGVEPETKQALPPVAGQPPPLPPDSDDDGPLISLRTCVYCQSTTDGGRSRCGSCGRRSCIYCGLLAQDDDAACTDCGAHFEIE